MAERIMDLHVDSSKRWSRVLEEAREHTHRRRVIWVSPPGEPRNSSREDDDLRVEAKLKTFCEILAKSEQRVAAVVLLGGERDFAYGNFAREVRELVSAEGGVLIWERSPEKETEDEKNCFGIKPDVVIDALHDEK